MGRPTLCMACLPIAISAGIELQVDQYGMSLLALKTLKSRDATATATGRAKTLHADV
jgi:hypothetical protein